MTFWVNAARPVPSCHADRCPPPSAFGHDDDFYLDWTNDFFDLYGPKKRGRWPLPLERHEWVKLSPEIRAEDRILAGNELPTAARISSSTQTTISDTLLGVANLEDTDGQEQ